MRYRLEVRLTASDAGKRVVLRCRRAAQGGDEVAGVLGILEAAGRASFTVRKASGEVVVIPGNGRWPAGRAARAGAPRDPGPGTPEALGGGDLAVPPRGGPVRAGPLTRPGRARPAEPGTPARINTDPVV